MLARFLNHHLRPYRGTLVLLVVLQLVQTAATLLLPTLNAQIIDNGVLLGDAGYIWSTGLTMLGVAAVQILTASGAMLLSSRTSAGLGRDLRDKVFRRVMTLSAREVDQIGAPSLITRTVNDVGQVQSIVLTTADVAVSAIIMCVGGIALALVQDVPVSMILIALVIIVIAGLTLMLKRLSPFYKAMQSYLDRINHLLREQIIGVRVIRAFVRDQHERGRFDATNGELHGTSRRVGRIMATMPVMVMTVMNVLTIGIIWLSGHRIDDGTMQLGALLALLSYVTLIIVAIIMAMLVFTEAPRAAVSANRVNEVLLAESSIARPRTPVTKMATRGHLELRGATFGYPGAEKPVLRDVSLTARPGETVAILGSTGSGKSTLLSLALRLYDVTGGQVMVNDTDIRDLDPPALHRIVGYVPQKAHLFSGTIASNLRYGKEDATDDELWHALEIAQAAEFVRPLGLDAQISQGGSTVSGGQRQRLAIARALVRRPEIYLLDDCFSALDLGTESRLRAALDRELHDATILLVTQRISTVEAASRVIVLEDGQVVGSGTHAELIGTNQTYREIALSQPVGGTVR
ncbi:ABC transporter ATP-binding protein [Lentzea sp. BCCO 10_0061]|uniref:ABC transporter ATP-binding protein n=1 Tax=Lentzea sokolovensis TaxID=3095429 RepID=A0ABU4UNZ0_9PSEU|nr:ABC transporter ATP-binding protein [Lentzea sp. BCCO 10_0061]MDX8141141.1 ABC transporter ATP-binding protein [Lentzea sp. BCCO 10_0061]